MIKSIIHAGGESTRLKEIFDEPKALARARYKDIIGERIINSEDNPISAWTLQTRLIP